LTDVFRGLAVIGSSNRVGICQHGWIVILGGIIDRPAIEVVSRVGHQVILIVILVVITELRGREPGVCRCRRGEIGKPLLNTLISSIVHIEGIGMDAVDVYVIVEKVLIGLHLVPAVHHNPVFLRSASTASPESVSLEVVTEAISGVRIDGGVHVPVGRIWLELGGVAAIVDEGWIAVQSWQEGGTGRILPSDHGTGHGLGIFAEFTAVVPIHIDPAAIIHHLGKHFGDFRWFGRVVVGEGVRQHHVDQSLGVAVDLFGPTGRALEVFLVVTREHSHHDLHGAPRGQVPGSIAGVGHTLHVSVEGKEETGIVG